MLGRRPSWGGCGLSHSSAISGALNDFRTTPTAAAGCCLPLLIQGGEPCHFHRTWRRNAAEKRGYPCSKVDANDRCLRNQSRHELPKSANPLMARLVSCAKYLEHFSVAPKLREPHRKSRR